MLQAGAKQSVVARDQNLHCSFLNRLCNHYKVVKMTVKLMDQNTAAFIIAADDPFICQCPRHSRALTE